MVKVMGAEVPEELAELAAAYGVSTQYWDQGGELVQVGAETVVAVLRSLGVDSSTPEAVAAALEDRRLRDWRRMLPPVFVMKGGEAPWCWVHVEHGQPARMWIDLEGGGTRWDIHQVDKFVPPHMVDGTLTGEATFAIPADLPLGWHTLRAESNGVEASCPLVVTPASLDAAALHAGRFWGFMTQVYSMRSERSWGMGDIVDMADLATWSASLGADHVLVNPLHAASPVPPMAPSPYLPVTKRFANAMYLRIEAIPEYAYLGDADRAAIEALAAAVRPMNTSAELLDRDPVWAAKKAALEILHHVPRSPGREASMQAYYALEGPGLVDWATWCVLSEQFGTDWHEWPQQYRDPESAEVAALRVEQADRIDFYMWQQWLIDEQLDACQSAAVRAGMRGGIVHDLAVGVHPDGADAWSLQRVMAQGVSVGAPPDMYNQMGQDWSQPPWMPEALAEAGFLPYRDMLRTILRHAGGIRVDHVLGLFRLWWVPEGMKPFHGTYVKFDHEAMVGILALEAHRAGAFVVGEDLGTVEDWIQDYLLQRGVMGTSILWFERHPDGSVRRPHEWRQHVLASVTVHDLPPTAGYLAGEHVRIRAELGLLTRTQEEERADLAAELTMWRQILRDYRLLGEGDDSEQSLLVALHRYLAIAPPVMLGLSLPDATGDRRAQNQPGTDQEYPNWRIPLCDGDGKAVLLEDLPNIPLLQDLVRAITLR
jgi:4-alpha-glucanotransferase